MHVSRFACMHEIYFKCFACSKAISLYLLLSRMFIAAYSEQSYRQVEEDFNALLVGDYLDPHRTLKAALTGDLKTKVEDCQLDPNKVEKGRLLSRGKRFFNITALGALKLPPFD